MIKKSSIAGTMVAVVGISLLVGFHQQQLGNAMVAGPGYLNVVSGKAVSQNDLMAKLTLTTNGTIPKHADSYIKSNPVTAFAWAYPVTHQAFVVAIHPSFVDSNQHLQGWHAHTASLTGGATSPHDLCIASIDSTPNAAIVIKGNTITVHVHKSSLPVAPERLVHGVGLSIQNDTACPHLGGNPQAPQLAVQFSALPIELSH